MAILTRFEKMWLIKRRRGWNAQQAAEAWGIKLSTLRSYESGHRNDPVKKTENNTLIDRAIQTEERRGGVLHDDWKPEPRTRSSVTKHPTKKTNDSPKPPPDSWRHPTRKRRR
jgi:hypothetical protein